jgi:hypothetical protein
MWIRTKIRLSTKIKPVSESVSVLNLVAEHLRTEEVLVVDVAEEAEAEVAGITLPEGNSCDSLLISGDTAIWKVDECLYSSGKFWKFWVNFGTYAKTLENLRKFKKILEES